MIEIFFILKILKVIKSVKNEMQSINGSVTN